MSEPQALTTDDQTRARKNGNAPAGNGPVGVSGDSTIISSGLTKRELFAAMAMQGMLANLDHANMLHAHDERAAVAVKSADALFKELAK